jgi:hypothetical protein
MDEKIIVVIIVIVVIVVIIFSIITTTTHNVEIDVTSSCHKSYPPLTRRVDNNINVALGFPDIQYQLISYRYERIQSEVFYLFTPKPDLMPAIHRYHSIAGTPIPDSVLRDDNIMPMFGLGSIGLLSALIYSYSTFFTTEQPGLIVIRCKFADRYARIVDAASGGRLRYEYVLNTPKVIPDLNPDIELITSPTNPEGFILKPLYNSKYRIYDAVYNWKFFTDDVRNYQLRDQDAIVYSSSKTTGVPGARLGYGFTPSHEIYELVLFYINTTSLGVSNIGYSQMIRSYMKTTCEMNEKLLKVMRRRQQQITQLLDRKGIDYIGVAGAYILVKLSTTLLLSIGILASSGEEFGYSNAYSRLNIQASKRDWDDMICRIKSI